MGEKQSKSADLANFVNDILKLEYKAYGLRQLARDSEAEASKVNASIEKENERADELWQKKREKLNELSKFKNADGTYIEEYFVNEKNKFLSISRLAIIWLLSFFASIPIIMIFADIIISNVYIKGNFLLIGFIFIMIPTLLTLLINLIYVKAKPTVRKAATKETKGSFNVLPNFAHHESELKKDMEKINSNLSVVVSRKENLIQNYLMTAKNLENQASEIDKIKQKMYDFNIIPEDYRYAGCLLELYKIFKNDLADNMREAIAIYETRVFRGEVIREIKRIGDMVVDLSDDIYDIRRDISNMGNEIQQMRRSQDSNAAMQAEMLSEMRATRYAVDSVRESNNIYEWYLNYKFWNE